MTMLVQRASKPGKKAVEEKMSAIAVTNANDIVFGECRTGKEQIARQIYQQSSREQKTITVVDARGAALVGTHKPSLGFPLSLSHFKKQFSKNKRGLISTIGPLCN